MRIGWILNDKWLEERPTGLYSSMASYRLRAFIPAGELSRRGFETAFIGVVNDAESFDRARRDLRNVDAVVFGKLFEAGELIPRLLRAARESGARTVVDICDDFFVQPDFAELYRGIASSADTISTASSFLAARIREVTARDATLVLDPYEGARGTPRWQPRERLEVLWFGNVINMTGVDAAVQGLRDSGIPLRLTIVTDLRKIVRDWERVRRPELAPHIDLDLRQWSLETTARALRECDAVLLPVDRKISSFYLAKGPDRMVESLWAGRFVAAHPIPAYEEFRDWAWVGEDISEGLQWALARPGEVVARVARAQEHIATRYSPAVVGAAWEALLTAR